MADRYGRRLPLMGAGLTQHWKLFLYLVLMLGAFLIQFCVQGAWGVIPAHLSELSPNQVRGFLPGFAYQCGVLLAGSVGAIESAFAEHMSYATAMTSVAAIVFAATAIIAAAGREKRGIDLLKL